MVYGSGKDNKLPPESGSSTDSSFNFAPLNGAFRFAKNLGKGITGIITKPMEGAMKGGVTGPFQGVVQGIAGLGVVILKTLTSASHGIVLGVLR